jgi:signal transduction histidine kinase/ActR/RegA family two-component response regulator
MASDIDAIAQLRRKYADLCSKYQTAVTKLQQQTLENTSTYRLGLWAMQTQGAGIAVVDGGAITLTNACFKDMAGSSGRQESFKLSEPDNATRYRTLGELVVAMAERTDKGSGKGDLFEREGHGQVIEVFVESVERTSNPPLIIVMVIDVTDRVRVERELSQARNALEHQGRMRAMGELASGVAHDLNNLLGSLTLRVALLKKGDAAFQAGQEKNIAAMERLLKDAASRVRCLQDFGRRPSGRQIGPIQLDAVIREAIEMVRAQVEERTSFAGVPVRIETGLGSPTYVTGASTAELRHMFINLLLNARDAMPQGGTVHIGLERTDAGAVVTVSDTGTGIPEAHLGRIFEPFFSTKGALGTGLGLSTAHGVMNELGGNITAANRPGGGAVFTLVFPVSGVEAIHDSGERTSPVPRPPSKVGPGQRILVIDDDIEHLQTTKAVIELEEQDVETAASGRDALMRIQAGARFDLVLCDAGMPELNGWQVAEAIKGLAPSMRVYLLTGWGEQIAEDEPRRGLIAGILPKPVNLRRIRSILTPAPAPKAEEANGAE